MIKPFLFTVVAVIGWCAAAPAAIIDYRDFEGHHHRPFDDHGYYSGDDGRDRHHDHHNFSWDDKWFEHDDGDNHHHDHDFRWWLVASSSGFDKHDHWRFDDRGRYCRPGDPGDPVSAVPLPSAVSMFGGALMLLGVIGWRRRIRQSAP